MGSVSADLYFRPATAGDVPNLLPLIKSAYRGHKGWTTEAHLVADERIDAAGLQAKMAEPNGVVLVAADQSADAAVISCCELLKRDDELAYFGLFAVDPDRQGGGLGRQVLAHAEQFARERLGVRRLEMTVISGRDELISWYQRRGFRVTGETRPFPYEHLVNGKALRDDLFFEVLVKDL